MCDSVLKGVEVRTGTVGGVRMEGDKATAVVVDGQDVLCEKVCVYVCASTRMCVCVCLDPGSREAKCTLHIEARH